MRVTRSIIRFVGKLQFRLPILKKPINYFANLMVSRGPTRIRSGEGVGLIINAKGCNPGFVFGTSEPLEQKVLAESLSSGKVFYDLGANAGFYCLIAARIVGRSGFVYGFEPTPTLAGRIRENRNLNGLQNLEVIEAAVCRSSGSIEFGIEGDMNVQNSISAASKANAKRIAVDAISIDDFVVNHRPPDVMMIDIEGAEVEALLGALETIRKHRPIIMVEVHWLGTVFTDFVRTYLTPIGYQATMYDGSAIPATIVRYHCVLRPTAKAT